MLFRSNVEEVPPAGTGDPGQLDEQLLMMFLALMMQGMTGAEGNPAHSPRRAI